MIKKFGFLCALSGAMVSFGLTSAMSAPVVEKTNLMALLKAGKQNDKAEKEQGGSNRTAYKKQAKTDKIPVIERRSARSYIDLKSQYSGKGTAKSDVKQTSAGTSGKPYSSIIARYASSYGVPLSLAHAVVRHESNYQPNVRGRAGEIGLMQIKLGTARGLGYTGSAKGLYDPATNLQYGMKYLALAQKLGGGSTCGTILKYNAGHGAKRMNPTSAKYCSNVKDFMRSF